MLVLLLEQNGEEDIQGGGVNFSGIFWPMEMNGGLREALSK